MSPEELAVQVSVAIRRAQDAEDAGTPTAAAWAEVSRLEEALAAHYPADHPDGAIAREGAVRAALKAGDVARGDALAHAYASDPLLSPERRREILGVTAQTMRLAGLSPERGGPAGERAEVRHRTIKTRFGTPT